MITLWDACLWGDLSEVNRLLAEGEDPTVKENEAIRNAATEGHLEVVNRLLELPGVDATAKENEAIRKAATFGHLGVVNRLLEVPGVDATAKDNNAICLAIVAGRWDVVYRLLEVPEIKENTRILNFLMYAATRMGHLKIVEKITEPLRLVILADFYAAHRAEQLKTPSKYLTLDFLNKSQKNKFKKIVFKKMGIKKTKWPILGFIIKNCGFRKEDIVDLTIKKYMIQKTFIQYQKQISLNEILSKTMPVELLGLISDYDESLNQGPEVNDLIKKESNGAQADKELEITQVNPKHENLLRQNKMLSLMHFELHKSIGEKGQDPKVNNEFNNKGLNLR